MQGRSREGRRTWSEVIEVGGSKLLEGAKALIAEGNVRRLIIRAPDDRVLVEIPLTAGVIAGGIITLSTPTLTALAAVAALLAKAKVEVIREEDRGK